MNSFEAVGVKCHEIYLKNNLKNWLYLKIVEALTRNITQWKHFLDDWCLEFKKEF